MDKIKHCTTAIEFYVKKCLLTMVIYNKMMNVLGDAVPLYAEDDPTVNAL